MRNCALPVSLSIAILLTASACSKKPSSSSSNNTPGVPITTSESSKMPGTDVALDNPPKIIRPQDNVLKARDIAGSGTAEPTKGTEIKAKEQPSSQSQSRKEPGPPPAPTCFTITYHHKALASHSSAETCSQHKNQIQLPTKDVNFNTLCVRVNNVPVKYERLKNHPDQIVIGAVAGPQAKITTSYCTGKNTCQQECKIPKDEFMDAIGGGDDSESGKNGGHWTAENGKAAPDVSAHIDAEMKRELANLDDQNASYVFKDWIKESEKEFCESPKHAVASDVLDRS